MTPLPAEPSGAPAVGYLEGLNPQQLEAVLAPPGPALVLAGAGSGKTRVIVRRILHLLSGGTPPGAILALTFTNKASGEMKERLAGALGPGAQRAWVSTFHAAGARILRAEFEQAGLPRDFTVMSRGECLTILKREMVRIGVNPERYAPRELLDRVGRLKTGREDSAPGGGFAKSLEAVAAEFAPAYEKSLRAAGGVDFDDLLALPLRLFRGYPEILDRYRERFEEILVDEYQDTNEVQGRLVRLLAGERRRVFAVGDDDQSIYGWRGAEIENIRRFEKDFPGAQIFRLEENYRSSANILASAGAVMARARGRREKRLFTQKPSGEPVVYFGAADPQVEAQIIFQRLEKAGAGEGISWGEVAVFYRTNTQSRPLEEEARRRGVPYQVVKGQRFFDRTEVQDLSAYLRAAARPEDAAAFTRILNRPSRGLGPAKVAAISGGDDLVSQEAARAAVAEGRVSGAAGGALEKLLGLLEELSAKRAGPAVMLEELIGRTGYRSWLSEISRTSTSLERRRSAERGLEGAREYLAAASAFEERLREEEGIMPKDPEAMTRFLEEMALSNEADEMEDEGGKLSLMTLHAAKGLEFRAVAVAGVQDGLLPHSRSIEEPESMEEERRLLYVGMTRAKEHLMLSWAAERPPVGSTGGAGGWTSYPSRFLDSIGEDLIRREDPPEARRRRPQFREGWGKAAPAAGGSGGTGGTGGTGEQKESKIPDQALGPFSPGARVVHPKFGAGLIKSRSGTGDRAVVTVDFERVGTKKLVLKHASLEPEGGGPGGGPGGGVDGGESPKV